MSPPAAYSAAGLMRIPASGSVGPAALLLHGPPTLALKTLTPNEAPPQTDE